MWLSKIEKTLLRTTSFFEGGRFYGSGNASSAKVVVVSSIHSIEVCQFFAIRSAKQLRSAVKLFAEQQCPYTHCHVTWRCTKRSEEGSFVQMSFFEPAVVDLLSSQTKRGAVLLSEALFLWLSGTDACQLNFSKQSRTYISDPNYGPRAVKTAGPVAKLMISSFTEELISFSDPTTFVTQRHLQLGRLLKLVSDAQVCWLKAKGNQPKRFAQLLGAGIAVVSVVYLLGTSLFLYWQSTSLDAELVQNRTLVRAVSSLDTNLHQQVEQAVVLSAPFASYLDKTELFRLLSSMEDSFKLSRLTVFDNSQITIAGETDNASSLFQGLAAQPNVSELKFVTPVRKQYEKEFFTLQFRLSNG